MGAIKQAIARVQTNAKVLYLSFFEIAWYKKILVMFFLLYAMSPIDFIPDFIPILGLFDDLIILSFGVWFCRKVIPKKVWDANYEKVTNGIKIKTIFKVIGAVLILAIWAAIITVIVLALI